jgi:RNA polymerase sigma-70 factor (sigma-E family)
VEGREDILVDPDTEAVPQDTPHDTPHQMPSGVSPGVSNDDASADPSDDFVAFFGAARASLMGQAVLLTGDVEDARDLVQEALLSAWKNWSTVRSYDDPQQWARRVLHNLAVSRWRRARVRSLARLGAPTQVAGPDASHLDVLKALRLLPMDQRRALVLHDVVGLNVTEVATEIGVPEGTVRSWLSRGRNALAKKLGIVAGASAEGGGSNDGS